jgi:hypothetical protein
VWLEFRAGRDVVALQKRRSKVPGFYDELMAGWRPSQGRCPWLESGVYVNQDGRASPCCMVKSEEGAYGQVGSHDVDQLLAHRAALRSELARGNIPRPCTGCELAKFAVIGKPALMAWGLRGLSHRLFG